MSTLITVDDLAVGDALNGSGHVMLFGGWADKAAGKATILQESRCGTDAGEKISTFKVIDATTLQISDGRNFRPIRYIKDRRPLRRPLQQRPPSAAAPPCSSDRPPGEREGGGSPLACDWGDRRGLNPRQLEPQSSALPTELRPP